MKASNKVKRGIAVADPATPPSPSLNPRLWWPLGFLAVYLVAYLVYLPALNGEFVFDDLQMLFLDRNARILPLQVWWGVRPLLATTYWANLHLSSVITSFPYHAVNVFFHATAAILLFFALRRVLDWAFASDSKPWKRDTFAAFGAALFLLHPMQTEAVSYIAQRGEDLGALFYFAAFCVFLYRKPGPISWPTTAAVITLYGAAVTTKEHTVTLPALLLLTDYFFNPGFTFEGIKRNWRLYAAFGVGAIGGVFLVLRLLRIDTASIGFQLKDFNAFQYLFTEFRVFFVYLGLFVYPLAQSIDYDFAISRTILDHGSIIALALILVLIFLSIRFRRRFPLAAYGFLVFGTLLLPTSSFIPILDPIADRRLYLPMIGLVFISIDFLRRLPIGRLALTALLSAICLFFSVLTYQRNEKWSNEIALWSDAAEKAPNKSRVEFGLATAEFLSRHCHESIPHYQRALELSKPDYQLYMNLGLAYSCDHQISKAFEFLDKSIELKPAAQSWASLAMVEAQQGQYNQALEALDKAQALDAQYAMTYVYRGGIYQGLGRTPEAIQQFQRGLDLDPTNAIAKNALETLRR